MIVGSKMHCNVSITTVMPHFPISTARKRSAIAIATSLSKLYRTIAITFAQWKQPHRQQYNPIFIDAAITQWKRGIRHTDTQT